MSSGNVTVPLSDPVSVQASPQSMLRGSAPYVGASLGPCKGPPTKEKRQYEPGSGARR